MRAAVRGFKEARAGLAVLGVGLELVLNVGDGTGSVAAVELERAVAVLAAELGIAVDEGLGEGLYLPEGFIAGAGGADAAAFDFALVELFRCYDNFGGHVAFLDADGRRGRCLHSTLSGGSERSMVYPSPLFALKSAADWS